MELWTRDHSSPYPRVLFDRSSVINLNHFLSRIPVRIVISSTWKKSMGIDKLRSIFEENGVASLPFSVTPNQESKGDEILGWLSENQVSSGEPYLVIDDQKGEIEGKIPDQNFLQVEDGWRNGFSRSCMEEALTRVLKKDELSPCQNIRDCQSNEPLHISRQHRLQSGYLYPQNQEGRVFRGRQSERILQRFGFPFQLLPL